MVTSGSGQYYIEFRSRYAWDYGHTYIVHGRVGEAPTKDSVAGLSPVGDDATAWVIGHYVPVPAETGWTDGDLEDKYVSARYRVLMSKDAVRPGHGLYQGPAGPFAHVERRTLQLQRLRRRTSRKFMGLKVPSSTLIYPKVFVTHLRLINTGHPDAAETLVSDNVKEMSNPTRDGRAMINNGVHTIRADGDAASTARGRADSGPEGHDRPSGYRAEAAKLDRLRPHRPLITDLTVQACKIQRDRRVGGQPCAFGCATTSPRDVARQAMRRRRPPPAASRSATSRRKRKKRSSTRSRRRCGIAASAKYQWAKFPAVVTEDSVNYCATVDAQSPYPAYNGDQAYIVEAQMAGGQSDFGGHGSHRRRQRLRDRHQDVREVRPRSQ